MAQTSSNKANKAFCCYCKQVLLAKKSDLWKHAKTSKHIKNADPYQSKSQKKINMNDEFNESKATAQAKLSTFIAMHCAIRSADHLNNITSSCFSKSIASDFKMHRTKCGAIISNVIGPYFESLLLEKLKNKKFSLLIDESTDISLHKMLGVVVRFFDDESNKIINHFLGLVEIENGTANEVVRGLKR